MRKLKLPIQNPEGYTIFLRNDNIIELSFYNGFYGELEDAKIIVEKIRVLSLGKKLGLVVIYAADNLFSAEARSFVAKHTYTKADALVGTSLALRIIGNFYLNINKPIRPTRLFNNQEAALKWLKEL